MIPINRRQIRYHTLGGPEFQYGWCLGFINIGTNNNLMAIIEREDGRVTKIEHDRIQFIDNINREVNHE